jgi:phosphate-selective porin OprO/OprP
VNDFYVDTGEIAGADRIGRLGLEASRVAGRFSWQTEIIGARVERKQLNKAEFWGAYALVSWFLTDDTRNYNFGSGSFDRVRVSTPFLDGGWGAFELGFRASYVDLSDADVVGGSEKNLSLGLNWYLNQDYRLMLNAVKVLDVDRPGSEFDGKDPLSLSLRFQWVWN